MRRCLLTLLLIAVCLPRLASAQIVLSGNEGKIDLTPGMPTVLADPEPDTLTILDFKTFPPQVSHLANLPNSVIGPPDNIAITPDGRLALIANSLKISPQDKTKWIPDTIVHVLDLTAKPPKLIADVQAGKQPSGISISPNGKRALVANRAEGSVTMLNIDGLKVTNGGTILLAKSEDQVSDVAIHPDGKLALVSVTDAGYLAVLRWENDKFVLSPRKLSTFGKPYRVAITSDGALGLTAGTGNGEAPDTDGLSVIDLEANPIRTVDHIAIGSGPESFEISPDGKLAAAVLMNGSNLASGAPNKTDHGLLTLLARRGKTFAKVQQIPIPRIPEGVAFTPDGKYLLIQGHPDKVISLFRVEGERVTDTGEKVKVPGRPSSLRAATR